MKLTSMKAALAVMFAGTVLVSCGNEGPNLKGNLKMDRDTLLIQVAWQKKSLLDTVVLKNGHFEATIPDSACFIYLFPKPKSEDEMITMCPKRILFLPGDKMTVSGDVYAPEVSGTELYDALNRQTEMKEAEREWLDKVQERNSLYTFDNRNAAAIDSLREVVSEAVERLDEARMDLVRREPDNIASAYAAIFLPEKESIEAYGMLDESVKNSAIAPVLESFISSNKASLQGKQNWESLKPGVQAPDFKLRNLDGEYMTLASFKGKYVLLDLEFVGIDCNDTEEKWKNGVAEHGLPWTNLYNGNGKEIVTAYGVQGYPTKIIIDPEGKIVAKFVGEDPTMYKKLDELF